METKKLSNFLKTLKANNNKDFFTQHKSNYEYLRDQFIDLIKDIIFDINKFDKKLGIIEPKNCIFRINRDLRFSKDKSPYKTKFSAQFTNNRKQMDLPTYYFHIDENNMLLVGGGLYEISKEKLENFREKILSYPEDFEEIIYNKEINKVFGGLNETNSLKKAPHGYDQNNSMIKYLKLRSYHLSKEISLDKIPDSELENLIIEHFKIIYPLIEWIRKSY